MKIRLTKLTVVFLSLTLVAGVAWADEHAWNVASGNWNTSTNWNPSGIPAAADTVSIKRAGSTCTLPSGYTSADVARVYINNSSMPTLSVVGTLVADAMARTPCCYGVCRIKPRHAAAQPCRHRLC